MNDIFHVLDYTLIYYYIAMSERIYLPIDNGINLLHLLYNGYTGYSLNYDDVFTSLRKPITIIVFK